MLLTLRLEKPAQFPLSFRIPGWATGASVRVNARELRETISPGNFLTLSRIWKPEDNVEILFPMLPRISRWYQDSAVIERGPLVYSLNIPSRCTRLVDRGLASDWEVLPTTDYALALDLNHLEQSVKTVDASAGGFPFTARGHHPSLLPRGKRLPAWQLQKDSAGPLPAGPVSSSEPEETLTLIPYGAAKLRITEFPVLAIP